jgi:1,4-dihydroxy-6-naphthoate synthase
MFYGLATDKFDTGSLRFTHVLKDIQTLNQVTMTTQEYDVTASRFTPLHTSPTTTLPRMEPALATAGPIVVARRSFPAGEINQKTIAVPGELTSAFLALRLHTPDFKYEVVPFDRSPMPSSRDAAMRV